MKAVRIASVLLGLFWLAAAAKKVLEPCVLVERFSAALGSGALGRIGVSLTVATELALFVGMNLQSSRRAAHWGGAAFASALTIGRELVPTATLHVGCGCHPFAGSSDSLQIAILAAITVTHLMCGARGGTPRHREAAAAERQSTMAATPEVRS